MNVVTEVTKATPRPLEPKGGDLKSDKPDKVALDFKNMIAKKAQEQQELAEKSQEEINPNSIDAIAALGKKQLESASVASKELALTKKMENKKESTRDLQTGFINPQSREDKALAKNNHPRESLDGKLKSAQDIARLSDENNLNMTKLKIDHKHNDHKVGVQKHANLVEKSEQTKVPPSLADLLSKISHDDALARKKSYSKVKSERDEIIDSKMRSKERTERYEAAIMELKSKEDKAQFMDKKLFEGVALKQDGAGNMNKTEQDLEGREIQDGDEKKVKKTDRYLEIKNDKGTFSNEFRVNQAINFSKANILSFASDIKEAIKNYTPPVTKLEIELNPKELGKIELNLTKNGGDLQVAITGNTHAIMLLASRQDDLLNSLQNIGFRDVDLNFSSGQNREDNQNSREDNASREVQDLSDVLTQEHPDVQFDELTIILPKYA